MGHKTTSDDIICRNLYKTYKTVGFVLGSIFFLTFCTTQDENQSVVWAPATPQLGLGPRYN
jgi:hypothetical protein